METLFTWLHLSDLRLRAPAGGAHERILAALWQDLAERADPRPDALLVTGDVTATGAPEEAIEARGWLTQAAQALGLGPERVFLVPGNHDVDRLAAGRTEAAQGRRSASKPPALALELRLLAELREGRRSLDAALDKQQARAVLGARLAPFAELAACFGGGSDDVALDPGLDPGLAWTRALGGRGGLRVRLVGLCTAWLSLDDDDRGQLRLGAGALSRVLPSIGAGELVVVLSHHPLCGGWLADEAQAAEFLVRAHAHVHLTGHVHDEDADAARAGAPGPFVWIAAGASPAAPGAPPEPRGLGWSLVKVVRAPGGEVRLQIAPRRWSSSRACFIADERVVREGRLSASVSLRFRLPAPRPLPPTDPPPPMPSVPPEDEGPVTRRPSQDAFEGPGSLPIMPVPCFTGRAAEMSELLSAIARAHEEKGRSARCVVVTGTGGVGKTALVQQFVATEARGLFDASAWLDARDLAAELVRIARRFGAPSARPEEAGAYLRAAMEERRVLLVIDGVAPGMASVRAFPVPSASSGSRLVVTSRIVTLHEDVGRLARPLRVAPWDAATCRAHLREATPDLAAAPDALLDPLGRAVGGLPLAMRLLVRSLRGIDGRRATPEVLRDRLDREPLALLDGAVAAGRGPAAERTVTATFQEALAGLGDIERRLLVALAACGRETRAEVVGAVAGMRADEAAMALEALAEQSLLEWRPESEQPYRLHPVLRMLLASLPGARAAEAAHEAQVDGLLARRGARGGARDLDRDLCEVLAVAHRRARRGDGLPAWEALSAILGVLDRRAMYADVVAAATQVLAALPPESVEAAAAHCEIGLAFCSLGDVAEATTSFEHALLIAEERAFPEGQARALSGLGRCYAALGEHHTALSHHQRAASIDERAGRRAALADDLGNIGLASRHTGDIPGAIAHLERALSLHEALKNLDGRAEVLGGLGLCHRDAGDPARAVDHFERARAIHEALGRRPGQAAMLGNLGNTYRALGELPKAITHLERALSLYEELGLLEGQGTALANLGACHRAAGDKEKARRHHERALTVLRQAGLPDEHPHVRAMLSALAPRGAGARRP